MKSLLIIAVMVVGCSVPDRYNKTQSDQPDIAPWVEVAPGLMWVSVGTIDCFRFYNSDQSLECVRKTNDIPR